MATATPTTFGQLLRYWRGRRGLSQLDLALQAQTTARHVSFIETGRSRAGYDVTVRLGRVLELQPRDLNALLDSAGHPPAFEVLSLDEDAMTPFVGAIRAILANHDPFPGSAFDPFGSIHLTNEAHRRLFPGAAERTPEEQIDYFLLKRAGLDFENWSEVAWSYADRWRLEASRTGNVELDRLAARAEAHLADTPRPEQRDGGAAVMSPRVRVDGETFTTFSTVLRFDTAREVNLSEIRVELIFPADAATKRFFEQVQFSDDELPV